jgi:hypothetical protein
MSNEESKSNIPFWQFGLYRSLELAEKEKGEQEIVKAYYAKPIQEAKPEQPKPELEPQSQQQVPHPPKDDN